MGGGHSSLRPTRRASPVANNPESGRTARSALPIWSCSTWGLPSPRTVAGRAVRFYRTVSPLPSPWLRGPRRHRNHPVGGLLSVALSVALPRLAVSKHAVRWSPDFPPPAAAPPGATASGPPARRTLAVPVRAQPALERQPNRPEKPGPSQRSRPSRSPWTPKAVPRLRGRRRQVSAFSDRNAGATSP